MSRALLGLLLGWLLLLGWAGEARAAPEKLSFAVVIGNNKSLGKRRPDLHYADDDAARYYEILQTMAPGRVWLLTELDRDWLGGTVRPYFRGNHRSEYLDGSTLRPAVELPEELLNARLGDADPEVRLRAAALMSSCLTSRMGATVR